MDVAVTEALDAAFHKARDLDAPINERLDVYSDALRRHFTPYAEAVDRLVARLQQTGIGASAPNVGDAMPPFLLPDDRAGSWP